jgi:hypothetical protein
MFEVDQNLRIDLRSYKSWYKPERAVVMMMVAKERRPMGIGGSEKCITMPRSSRYTATQLMMISRHDTASMQMNVTTNTDAAQGI